MGRWGFSTCANICPLSVSALALRGFPALQVSYILLTLTAQEKLPIIASGKEASLILAVTAGFWDLRPVGPLGEERNLARVWVTAATTPPTPSTGATAFCLLLLLALSRPRRRRRHIAEKFPEVDEDGEKKGRARPRRH